MKRFSTLLGKTRGSTSRTHSPDVTTSTAGGDGSDAEASRAVRLFCESGSTTNRDEELLHLPAIVDAAESSPRAATACAAQIRDFLQKSYKDKPHVQYNAIMLIRILSDNPGASFTRNFDDKFVKVIKTLLREGRDKNVQQILRETLDHLEVHRASDAGAQGLVQMWRREKGKHASLRVRDQGEYSRATGERINHAPANSQIPSMSRSHSGAALPPPAELSSRIEEARNTAKILIQFLQTTPTEELFGNELIKEFSERCQSAQRSMQAFINCDNPIPDDNTLQTLIETNEQLSLANSRHQRAILAARRALGAASPGTDASAISPINNSQVAPVSSFQLSTQPQQETGVLSLPPRPPQENGFGTFGSPTTNGNTYGAQANNTQPSATIFPSAVPPQAPAQKANVTINPQVQALQNDDYDDLYDSPAVNRAPPASNPFADPVDPPSSAQTGSQGQSSFGSPTSPAHQKSYAASSNYSPAPDSATTKDNSLAARPGPGPWHDSNITESFLGRQANAADGVTMHAPATAQRQELDGHSNVGRS